MEADCQSLYSTASRNGLLLSSNLTLSGTVVWLACDHTDQRIDGHSRLTCRNGTWSSGLPQCADNKLLTEREIIIIASSSAAGAALLILSLALTIYFICAKRKQLYRRSQRLQQKLQTWSMRDPLEEFVQRESVNQVTDVSYKPTALVRMSTRRESHLFKIWNQSRTIKKLVFAGSMMELIQAASERLKLPHPDKIVLEEDGTEVTSDEILLACAGSILLVLQPGEEWEPSLTLDGNQLPPTFNNLHRHSTISIIKSLQNIGAEMKTVRPKAGGAVVNEGYDILSDEDKISQ